MIVIWYDKRSIAMWFLLDDFFQRKLLARTISVSLNFVAYPAIRKHKTTTRNKN